ncbi:MAG: hypothetical protein AB1566_12800 [Chloroflexota bacterium]
MRRLVRFLFVTAGVLAMLGLVLVGAAYAAAAYRGNWSEQPDWGNHWWYNYSWDVLEWYADDLWSPSHAQSMKDRHNNLPWNEYRIEQEAYNPGNGTSCDRLVISSYDAMDLPVTAWSPENGCGDSAYKEELKIELDENAIPANTWLRHRVTYNERNRGSGGDGEVNYSFAHNHDSRDSWLGKIVYNQWFDKLYSDPSGLVN